MKFACLILMLIVLGCEATKLRNCELYPAPIQVRMDDCTAEPCKVKKGTTARIEIDFIVLADTKTMTASVLATVGSVQTHFPLLSKGIVCNYLKNGYCPVDKNEHLTYALEMKVAKFYPTTAVDTQITITDDEQNIFSCFKLRLNVVD